MIGVVVPAHDEEEHIEAAIRGLLAASTHPGLHGEEVRLLFVLDACGDATAEIVLQHGLRALHVDLRNVGMARALGADCLAGEGVRWLAFTDADTVVATDWLVAQLGVGTPVVCGTIGVDDWALHPPPVGARFVAEYQDRDGHRHVHGANLGLCTEAYRAVGGFAPLAAHEDRTLVEALERAGFTIGWSAAPRVVTSTRLRSRAPEGFAHAIRAHYAELGLVPVV
ncbi:MAG: glycosyltransferase [Proteobacteria bacterium]|nr:MAG: glycosyltransferase [Pseudomonadota bacterium]